MACECGSYISNVEKAVECIESTLPPAFLDTGFNSLTNLAGKFVDAKTSFVDYKIDEGVRHAMVVHPKNRNLNEFKIKDKLKATEILNIHEEKRENWHTVLIDSTTKYDPTAQSEFSSNFPPVFSALSPIFLSGENEISPKFLSSDSVTKFLVDDFHLAQAGGKCGKMNTCDCSQKDKQEKGKLIEKRGIEVGHIFYLGQKYSRPLKAMFDAPDNTRKVMEMGCYGELMLHAILLRVRFKFPFAGGYGKRPQISWLLTAKIITGAPREKTNLT